MRLPASDVRSTVFPARVPGFAPALASLALVGGCDLLGIPTEVEIPIPLDTPPVEVDVGGAVDEAVEGACDDPDDAACVSLGLICRAENGPPPAEGGDPCSPPVLPPEFPKEVENLDGEIVSADSLVPEDVKKASQLKFAIPIDLAEALANQGVSSADQVKQISFNKVDLAWEENGLTFDAPVLDLYIGPKVDDVGDPAELIATSGFAKIGTVGKDLDDDGSFDVGQEALVADAVPLTFVEGGNERFNEALRSFAFTLVLVAPDGQQVTLKEVEGSSPVKVFAPDGLAKLKVKSELSFKVNLADALSSAQQED
jgi:hypothetical protein